MPQLKKGVGGVFTRQCELLGTLDAVAANYIKTKAEATNEEERRGPFLRSPEEMLEKGFKCEPYKL